MTGAQTALPPATAPAACTVKDCEGGKQRLVELLESGGERHRSAEYYSIDPREGVIDGVPTIVYFARHNGGAAGAVLVFDPRTQQFEMAKELFGNVTFHRELERYIGHSGVASYILDPVTFVRAHETGYNFFEVVHDRSGTPRIYGEVGSVREEVQLTTRPQAAERAPAPVAERPVPSLGEGTLPAAPAPAPALPPSPGLKGDTTPQGRALRSGTTIVSSPFQVVDVLEGTMDGAPVQLPACQRFDRYYVLVRRPGIAEWYEPGQTPYRAIHFDEDLRQFIGERPRDGLFCIIDPSTGRPAHEGWHARIVRHANRMDYCGQDPTGQLTPIDLRPDSSPGRIVPEFEGTEFHAHHFPRGGRVRFHGVTATKVGTDWSPEIAILSRDGRETLRGTALRRIEVSDGFQTHSYVVLESGRDGEWRPLFRRVNADGAPMDARPYSNFRFRNGHLEGEQTPWWHRVPLVDGFVRSAFGFRPSAWRRVEPNALG